MNKTITRHPHPATNGSKWIRPEKRMAIYLRDGLACVYCGEGVEHDHSKGLTS